MELLGSLREKDLESKNKRITFAIQKDYKSVTKDKFMKAKKSSPKSIRFNIKDFEKAMEKGGFESAQDMVDFLLRNYAEGSAGSAVEKQKVTSVPKGATKSEQELTKSEMFKMIREGKM